MSAHCCWFQHQVKQGESGSGNAAAAHLLAELVDHVFLLCLQPAFQVHLLLDQLLQEAQDIHVNSTAARLGVTHINRRPVTSDSKPYVALQGWGIMLQMPH
jgi:hypothetical protein